ncbi:BfpM-like protein, partial [Escherichia coli SHECO002]
MNREIQQRLQWVKLYETSGDAGFVCRRCGISRPTLRKMVAQISGSGHRWSGKPQPSPQAFTINENRHLRSRSDSGVTFSAKSGGKTYSKRVKTTSFNLTGNSNNPQSPFPESGLNRPGF